LERWLIVARNKMCQLKQHIVKKIKDKTVYLKDGIRAFYDKKIGEIKPNDKVLVYGNLIIKKYEKPAN